MQAIRRSLTFAWVLIASMSPLIAQAEAAESLAQSLGELVAPGVIEPGLPADGADLSASSLMKAEPHPGLSQGRDLHVSPDFPIPPALQLTEPLIPRACPDGPGRAIPTPFPGSRRQAVLQVFRF